MITWNEVLSKEISKEYYKNEVVPFLRQEYSSYECYPSKDNIFKAFYSIPNPSDIKVVILGQDPYHEPGQANGLAFSVKENVKNPPSLENIIQEIQNEYGYSTSRLESGDLTYLANQGVLLLNSTLTVRRGQANSHSECGWQTFTDDIIRFINLLPQPIVFMLWGKYARRKKNLIINRHNRLILETSHPSPLSANKGFLGCDHFKNCNKYLIENGVQPIEWL